jgi:hypothetical protein
MIGKLAQFKLWPERKLSNHYWSVLVFNNKGNMRRAFHVLNATDDKDDRFGAVVMPQERMMLQWTANGHESWVSHPSLGYVLFAKTQLGSETQSHEAFHMAMGYFRRIECFPKLDPDGCNGDEEDLAYIVGKCAAQLHRKFFKLGLYE